MRLTELQHGVSPPTALVKGQKPLCKVSNSEEHIKACERRILGAAPAGNRVVVAGATRQLGQVVVGGLGQVVGGVVLDVCSGASNGPRAALGSVPVAAHEPCIENGGAGVDLGEGGRRAGALQQGARPLIVGRSVVVGLLEGTRGSDDVHLGQSQRHARPENSQSVDQSVSRYVESEGCGVRGLDLGHDTRRDAPAVLGIVAALIVAVAQSSKIVGGTGPGGNLAVKAIEVRDAIVAETSRVGAFIVGSAEHVGIAAIEDGGALETGINVLVRRVLLEAPSLLSIHITLRRTYETIVVVGIGGLARLDLDGTVRAGEGRGRHGRRRRPRVGRRCHYHGRVLRGVVVESQGKVEVRAEREKSRTGGARSGATTARRPEFSSLSLTGVQPCARALASRRMARLGCWPPTTQNAKPAWRAPSPGGFSRLDMTGAAMPNGSRGQRCSAWLWR